MVGPVQCDYFVADLVEHMIAGEQRTGPVQIPHDGRHVREGVVQDTNSGRTIPTRQDHLHACDSPIGCARIDNCPSGRIGCNHVYRPISHRQHMLLNVRKHARLAHVRIPVISHGYTAPIDSSSRAEPGCHEIRCRACDGVVVRVEHEIIGLDSRTVSDIAVGYNRSVCCRLNAQEQFPRRRNTLRSGPR